LVPQVPVRILIQRVILINYVRTIYQCEYYTVVNHGLLH